MNANTPRFTVLSLLLALLFSACTAIPAPTFSKPSLDPVAAGSGVRAVLSALRTGPGGVCALSGAGVTLSVPGSADVQVSVNAGLPLKAVACTVSGTRRQVALTFSQETLPASADQDRNDAQAQSRAAAYQLAGMPGNVQTCSVGQAAGGALDLTLQTDRETVSLTALPGSTFAECWQEQAGTRVTGVSVTLYRNTAMIDSGEEH